MIKNVLIDVDGTLLDSKNAFYNSLNKTLDNYGIKKTYTDKLFGMSVENVLDMLGIYSVQGIKEHWEKLFALECEKIGLYAGIENMLMVLSQRKIRFLIVTSRSYSTINPLFLNSELSRYIEGFVAAEDTKYQKPSPEPILKALERLNAKKDETIYIGDSIHDYHAAATSGILFCQAGWNKDSDNELYDLIFYHPSEIINFIGGVE